MKNSPAEVRLSRYSVNEKHTGNTIVPLTNNRDQKPEGLDSAGGVGVTGGICVVEPGSWVITLPRLPFVPLPQPSQTQLPPTSSPPPTQMNPMESADIQVNARRNSVPVNDHVNAMVDATRELPPYHGDTPLTPPNMSTTPINELDATATLADLCLPQMTTFSVQHLPCETNALGLEIYGITSDGWLSAAGNARGGAYVLALEERIACESMPFGTVSQTGPQMAGTGISPSVALGCKTTEKETTETAAAPYTWPVFNSKPLEQNTEEEGKKAGYEANEGTDFTFTIGRILTFLLELEHALKRDHGLMDLPVTMTPRLHTTSLCSDVDVTEPFVEEDSSKRNSGPLGSLTIGEDGFGIATMEGLSEEGSRWRRCQRREESKGGRDPSASQVSVEKRADGVVASSMIAMTTNAGTTATMIATVMTITMNSGRTWEGLTGAESEG